MTKPAKSKQQPRAADLGSTAVQAVEVPSGAGGYVASYTEWVQYQFPAPVMLAEYAAVGNSAATNQPKAWQLLGSDDGADGVALDEQADRIGWTANEERAFALWQ